MTSHLNNMFPNSADILEEVVPFLKAVECLLASANVRLDLRTGLVARTVTKAPGGLAKLK